MVNLQTASFNIQLVKTNSNQFFKATFIVDKINYSINAEYPLRKLTAGQKVLIVFDSSNPQNAAVYNWWGYWFQWDELLASILIPFILFFAANAITKNPTPEALIEDMEMDNPVKRRKYD